MFNQKIKNSYLFFLMLNAFLLMSLLLFTQKIFAQTNEEPKQTQIAHNIRLQDDISDIVETVNDSFADKIKIGMAKVVDELKDYAEAQHSDKTSKKMIQNVVNDIINNYLSIDEWAEVKTDFFNIFKYDGDWMKDIVTSILTNIVKNTITTVKSSYKSSYFFIFDSFTKDIDDAVSDTISTLWPTFPK
ncbi:hypothetical protein [Italian clover phyllody phytoplasma]|uniref:hypothetical protein n=1 Tax=Italian clover phyllody phytoplasma TaxID=1196420 RepID=UPI0002F64816|nr:hypothetical protein [Italian clover phyllody phytoplasma]